jgi:hypothetical protein
MISILIYLIVIALLVGLVIYVVDALAIPAPLNRGIKVAAVVIGCIAVVIVLLRLAGVDTGIDLPAN